MAQYVPSEVVNDQPETDRIILINNLRTVEWEQVSHVDISGARTMRSIAPP
jgi:hypothetical protein